MMIYKKGPRDDFANYRAICLLCHSYMLLSADIARRLMEVLDGHLDKLFRTHDVENSGVVVGNVDSTPTTLLLLMGTQHWLQPVSLHLPSGL